MFRTRWLSNDPYRDSDIENVTPVPAVAVPSSSQMVEVQHVDAHPVVVEGSTYNIGSISNTEVTNLSASQSEHQRVGDRSGSTSPGHLAIGQMIAHPIIETSQIYRNHDSISNQQQQYVVVTNAVPTAFSALQPNVIPLPTARSNSENQYDRERILLNLYQRSRFVRLVALLDVCFIIIFGLFSPLFLILLPFPLCGYWGARRWIYRLLFAYALYLVLELIGCIISFLFFGFFPFFLVRLIYMVLNLIVARYTINLASYVLVMDAEDMEFMKHSPIITNIEKNMIC